MKEMFRIFVVLIICMSMSTIYTIDADASGKTVKMNPLLEFPNPGLDEDIDNNGIPDGWLIHKTTKVILVTDKVVMGKAAKFEDGYVLLSCNMKADNLPGLNLKISFDAAGEGNSQLGAMIGYSRKDKSGNVKFKYSRLAWDRKLSSNYQKLKFYITFPENAVQSEIAFAVYRSNNKGIVWLDNFKLISSRKSPPMTEEQKKAFHCKAQEERMSIVPNGDFEQFDERGKPVGWTINWVKKLSGGNHVMRVPFTWKQTNTFDIEPNTRYVLSMRVRNTEGAGCARLLATVLDVDEKQISRFNLSHSFIADGWETARGILISGPSTKKMRLALLVAPKKAGIAFECDDVEVVPYGHAEGAEGTVWKIKKPLFKELLSDQPLALDGESAFIWTHPLGKSTGTKFALQYGQRYDHREVLEEFRRHRLHPYSRKRSEYLGDWPEKSGVGVALYSAAHWSGSIPTSGSFKFLYDKKGMDKYVESMRKEVTCHSKDYWGVTAGDEAIEHNEKGFVTAYNNPKLRKKFPSLDIMGEEIKRDFGYGQYGPPSDPKADEPFNWLALRRWMMSRVVTTQKRLYETAKSLKVMNGKPPIVFGEDSRGGIKPYHYSRQGPYIDAATGQQVAVKSPWDQNIAFKVKFLRDLTGKPVWPCLHFGTYAGSLSVEEVNEFISQVVRVGGSGLQIWNSDYAGRMRGTNGTIWDFYGHRARWDYAMSCLDRMRTMGHPNFPEPDCAIFFSNDDMQTDPTLQKRNKPVDAAFRFFGPSSGVWFQFISDIQLKDKDVSLNDWKVVIVPQATIQRREISKMFIDYPHDGRMLVSFDPEIFSSHADGSSTTDIRKRIFGVITKEQSTVNTVVLEASKLWPGISAGSKLLLIGGKRWAIQTDPDAKILARFEDGSPAITCKSGANGGKAIYTAFSLMSSYVVDPTWRNFMKAFAQGLGLKTDRKIWRFRFPLPDPMPTPSSEQDPGPVCFTGNNMTWWKNVVITVKNAKVKGCSYRYSLLPDLPAETAKESSFSFTEGDLTDRLDAPKAGDVYNRMNKAVVKRIKSGELSLDQFIVGWSKPDSVEIIFDLGQKVSVERVRVVYGQHLPSLSVAVSNDGKDFTKVGAISGLAFAESALDTEISFPAQTARFVRLRLGKRIPGDKLLLSEVEIWGDNKKEK